MALEGTIPTELGNLSSLSYLDLGKVKIVHWLLLLFRFLINLWLVP
jgi:hypothetical protein